MKRPIEIGDNLAFVLIILIIMVICLLGGYLESKAQMVTLPSWVADSLIYEVKLSRQCTQVTAAQALEIESLNKELNATGKALVLSQSSNETLSALLNNSRDANTILGMQFQKDLNTEKKKTKRWRRIGIIQAAVIIVIILTPSI